jgi:hypothetical protein
MVAGFSERRGACAWRDALVALTDRDREQVTAFIRSLYLAGVKDPKRLTFKGLQGWPGPERFRRHHPRKRMIRHSRADEIGWGLFLLPPLMHAARAPRTGARFTLHGVVFDIFVQALSCTAGGTLRRAGYPLSRVTRFTPSLRSM